MDRDKIDLYNLISIPRHANTNCDPKYDEVHL